MSKEEQIIKFENGTSISWTKTVMVGRGFRMSVKEGYVVNDRENGWVEVKYKNGKKDVVTRSSIRLEGEQNELTEALQKSFT